MTKETVAAFSIDDLDAESACETPVEFEFIDETGANSGIFLQVLGGESATVKTKTNELMDQRRRQDEIRHVNVRPGKPAPITPTESDIAFGKRLAAIRLVGWRGIKEPYSPELALKLVTKRDELSAQVLTVSNDIARFMNRSSPTS